MNRDEEKGISPMLFYEGELKVTSLEKIYGKMNNEYIEPHERLKAILLGEYLLFDEYLKTKGHAPVGWYDMKIYLIRRGLFYPIANGRFSSNK